MKKFFALLFILQFSSPISTTLLTSSAQGQEAHYYVSKRATVEPDKNWKEKEAQIDAESDALSTKSIKKQRNKREFFMRYAIGAALVFLFLQTAVVLLD